MTSRAILVPSSDVRFLARQVLAALAAVVLVTPFLGVPDTILVSLFFWSLSCWWLFTIVSQALYTREWERRKNARALELGRSRILAEGSARAFATAIVFLAGFQRAELRYVWLSLALLALFSSGFAFFMTKAARSHPAMLTPVSAITDDELNRRVRIARVSQPFGIALFVAWVYAWRRLAA